MQKFKEIFDPVSLLSHPFVIDEIYDTHSVNARCCLLVDYSWLLHKYEHVVKSNMHLLSFFSRFFVLYLHIILVISVLILV